MAKVTKIAHVVTYAGGAVSCDRNHALDFWKTGTIRANGAGYGTCQPATNKLHFDIILPNPNGVVAGSKLFIEYENGGGLVKTVTGITVRPPASTAHAVSVHIGGVSLSSALTISKRRPTSDSKARYAGLPPAAGTDDDPGYLDKPSWFPEIKFDITLVLFNRFRISTSAGDVSVPELLDADTDENDRDLSASAPPAQNGGYGAAPAPGATPS